MAKIGFQKGVWSTVLGLAGGGAVMIWPDQIYIGYSLLVAAFLLAGWGFTINGNQWWRRPSPKKRDIPKWVSLHTALKYIALNSEWAFQVPPAAPVELDKLLERELKESLARGDLVARGKETRNYSNVESATSTPIKSKFWETAFFQAFAEIQLVDHKRSAAARDGKFLHAPARSYVEITVNQQDIERLWPAAPIKVRKKSKTVFYEALIEDFIAAHDGDQQTIDDLRMYVASHEKFRD